MVSTFSSLEHIREEEVSVLPTKSCYHNTNSPKTQHQTHSHQQLQLQHGQHLALLGSPVVEDVVLLLHDRVSVCRAGHIHQDLHQQRFCISPRIRSSLVSLLLQPVPCPTPPSLPYSKQLLVPCLSDTARTLVCIRTELQLIWLLLHLRNMQTQKWWITYS